MTKDELLLLRRRTGVTQDELAKKIGRSRQSVINWERGEHAIPARLVPAILDACSTPIVAKPTAAQSKTDRTALEVYTKMRVKDHQTHEFVLKIWADGGFTPSPEAQRMILDAFPDILQPKGNDQ